MSNRASENLDVEVAEGEPHPKYYYDVDSNAELAEVFGIIRDGLARNMYLAR